MELQKPSPVGEGGLRSGFPETSIAQFLGFAMVVDEEFLRVCNYSSVCSPIFNLRTLCTLLASTFSRKRRLYFEQILTPIYKNWFTFRTDAHGAPLRVRANNVRQGGVYRCVRIVRTKASLREGGGIFMRK